MEGAMNKVKQTDNVRVSFKDKHPVCFLSPKQSNATPEGPHQSAWKRIISSARNSRYPIVLRSHPCEKERERIQWARLRGGAPGSDVTLFPVKRRGFFAVTVHVVSQGRFL